MRQIHYFAWLCSVPGENCVHAVLKSKSGLLNPKFACFNGNMLAAHRCLRAGRGHRLTVYLAAEWELAGEVTGRYTWLSVRNVYLASSTA